MLDSVRDFGFGFDVRGEDGIVSPPERLMRCEPKRTGGYRRRVSLMIESRMG